MKIFYHCYGSSHTSIVSAAIHLGILPDDRIPTIDEILKVPHYDQGTTELIGTPIFFGVDEFGCDVYAIGLTHAKAMFKRAIRSFLAINNVSEQELVMADALARISIYTRIGGYLSRGLGIVSIGRPLSAYGIQRTYYNFVDLTQEVKQKIMYLQR